MAWSICLLRYKTGNATAKTTGGLADWIAWASRAGSRRSAFGQGSEPSWQKQMVANRANGKKDLTDSIILLARRRCHGRRCKECDCVGSGCRLQNNLGNSVERRWKIGGNRLIAPGCHLQGRTPRVHHQL